MLHTDIVLCTGRGDVVLLVLTIPGLLCGTPGLEGRDVEEHLLVDVGLGTGLEIDLAIRVEDIEGKR